MSIHGLLQGVINSTTSGGGGGGGGGGGPTYRAWTIEWWGKKLSPQTNGVPRVFACGVDTGASIGFSNESGGDYIWTGGTGTGPITVGSIANTWVHWAIVSDGSNLNFYKNGVNINISGRAGSAITDASTNFTIGNDTSSFWKGRITDFHIIKGTAKYTSDFTPPTSRIQVQSGTQTLLYADGNGFQDAAGLGGRSVSDWTYSTDDPYNDGAGSIEFNGSSTTIIFQGQAAFALDVA